MGREESTFFCQPSRCWNHQKSQSNMQSNSIPSTGSYKPQEATGCLYCFHLPQHLIYNAKCVLGKPKYLLLNTKINTYPQLVTLFILHPQKRQERTTGVATKKSRWCNYHNQLFLIIQEQRIQNKAPTYLEPPQNFKTFFPNSTYSTVLIFRHFSFPDDSFSMDDPGPPSTSEWISGCDSILPRLPGARSAWLRCEVLNNILLLLSLVPGPSPWGHDSSGPPIRLKLCLQFPQRSKSSKTQKVKIKGTVFTEAAFGVFPSVLLRVEEGEALLERPGSPVLVSASSTSSRFCLTTCSKLCVFLPKPPSPQAWPWDFSMSSYREAIIF